MIILARAPFLAILSGLAVMIALHDLVALWTLPLVALLVAMGVTAISFCEELKGQWRVAGVVSLCVLMLSLWIVFSLNRSVPIPNYVKTTGVVVESRPWGRSYAAAVKTPQGGFLLRVPSEALVDGDVIKVEGHTAPLSDGSPDSTGSPGSDFREDRYWMARGVRAELTSFKTEPAAESDAPVWNIHRWRHSLYLSLIMNMPRLTGAYLNAAWTGKRDAMLNKAHRSWGTSHILAVSAFHVGVAMAGASFLLKRGRWRVPLLSLVLWLYIFLTGAPASAIRAGLMIQAGLAGELVGRPGSPLNSVSLAAVLLLLHSPFWFWDVGWRLSVLAAAAIAVTLERWGTFGFRTWLFMNLMIWLATFPQVSWTFESMPAAGLILNLVVLQFFGIAFSAASIAAALFLLGVPASSFLVRAVEWMFTLWEIWADAVARLIPWQLEWRPIAVYCCAALFIMFACRALFVPWRNVAVLSPLGALVSFVLFTV